MTLNPIDQLAEPRFLKFLQLFQKQVGVAFRNANSFTISHFEEPDRPAMHGHSRHALCEAAVRQAARMAGLDYESVDTNPAGGQFVRVTCAGGIVVRSNVQTHCGTPRSAVFRKKAAEKNEHLNPFQFDFLKDMPTPSEGCICAMLVVTVDPCDQSDPAFIGLGIPRADLSGWIVRESITDILARYPDIDATADSSHDSDVKVPDSAIPKLKKGVTKKDVTKEDVTKED